MGIVPVKSVSEIVKEVSLDKSDKDVGIVPSLVPVLIREVKEVGRSAIPVNWFPLISKLDKLDGKDGKIPKKVLIEIKFS